MMTYWVNMVFLAMIYTYAITLRGGGSVPNSSGLPDVRYVKNAKLCAEGEGRYSVAQGINIIFECINNCKNSVFSTISNFDLINNKLQMFCDECGTHVNHNTKIQAICISDCKVLFTTKIKKEKEIKTIIDASGASKDTGSGNTSVKIIGVSNTGESKQENYEKYEISIINLY